MKPKLGKGKQLSFDETGFINDALHTVLRPKKFNFFEGSIPTKLLYERPGIIRELSENIRDSRIWSKNNWKTWLQIEEKQGDSIWSHNDAAYYAKLASTWINSPEDVGPIYVLFYNDGSWDIGDGWHRTAISIVHNEPKIYAVWGEEKSTTNSLDGIAMNPFNDLTKRQRLALRQALANGTSSAPTSVLKPLERMGLIAFTGHYYEPQEWGKVVRREPIFYLTPDGQEAAELIKQRLEQ